MLSIVVLILVLVNIVSIYELKKIQIKTFNLIIGNKEELNNIFFEIKNFERKVAVKYIKKKYRLTRYFANEIAKKISI